MSSANTVAGIVSNLIFFCPDPVNDREKYVAAIQAGIDSGYLEVTRLDGVYCLVATFKLANLRAAQRSFAGP